MRSSDVRAEIEKRLSFFPPFLAPALDAPEVLEGLWRHTLSAYLDNPLPALFKEQLLATLSRACATPYCIVVHSCALRALGMSARQVLELHREPPPAGEPDPEVLSSAPGFPAPWPDAGSPLEVALRRAAVFLFLSPERAGRSRAEILRLLGPANAAHLAAFLAYVRATFAWAEAHPDLSYEADRRAQEHLPALMEEPELAELFRDHRLRVERQRREGPFAEVRGRIDPRSAAILAAALDCVITMDREGRIKEFNPAAERTFGYARADAIGKEMASLIIPPAQRDQHRRGLARYLETGVGPILGQRLEMTAMRAGGAEFPVELIVVPIQAGPEEPLEFAGYVRDLTDKKRMESERDRVLAEFQEAVRARDEFMAIASHELKTPMTSLKLRLQNVLRTAQRGTGEAVPPKLLAQLELLERSLDRLGELVDKMLDITRIVSRRLSLTLEEVDLAEVVRDVTNRFGGDLGLAGSQLDLRILGPVVGRWDRLRLEQIAANLLSNAIKYGEGKPIVVSLGTAAGAAWLTVQDHGIGIAPEDQARIFQRFERAAPVHNYGGMGLGLWIARQMVEAMGGAISVTSRPGQGSEFRVVLPLRQPGSGERSAASLSESPSR